MVLLACFLVEVVLERDVVEKEIVVVVVVDFD